MALIDENCFSSSHFNCDRFINKNNNQYYK